MPGDNIPFPENAQLVAYCRDSGGREQDLSIPQQETKIGEWCQTHGYILVRVFKDAARSGTTTAGRDQFLEMFAYLSRGADVSGIVLWEYARLSRSYDDAMFYLADLRRQGFEVYSVSDQVPEGIEGRLMESIVAWKNAKYSADLSRNVRRGKAYIVTALKGWPHAVSPLGYKKEYFQAGFRRDGSPHLIARLVVDPVVAPLIQRAYDLRSRGASYTEIRQTVYLVGRNSSIAPILHNPIYIGIYAYGDLHIEEYCPAIVDQDTWQQAQLVNDSARKRAGVYHSRRINSVFLLSGLVFCNRCGSPLTGLHTKPKAHLGYYSYYLCPNRPYKRTAEVYCNAPSIPKDLLEQRLVSRVINLLDTPQVLVDLQVELICKLQEQDAPRQVSERQAQADLEDNHKRIQRVTAAIQAAGHSEALITDLTALEQRRDSLRSRLVELATHTPPPAPPEDLFTMANNLRAAIVSASGRDLQRLFRLVVLHVRVELLSGTLVGEIKYKVGAAEGVLSI